MDKLVLYAVLRAFTFAGGPDVPDAVYEWRMTYISSADNHSVVGKYPVMFQSQNECTANFPNATIKLQLPSGSYPACLPVLRDPANTVTASVTITVIPAPVDDDTP